MLEQRVRIGLAAVEHDRAVERKRRLDGPQLDHPRDRLRRVRRPHHRRRLDRFGALGGAGVGQAAIDGLRAPPASSPRLVEMSTSAAMSDFASRPNTSRTL